MTRRRSGVAGALVAGLALASAPAPAAYVTDKLMVGVHDAPDAKAEAARLVQGGTPVEVLQRGGEFLEVRLPDGGTGWVETRFVTDDRPATFLLLEAQAAKTALERELAALRERQILAQPEAAAPLTSPPPESTAELQGWGGWWLLPLALLTFAAGYVMGRRRP